ncbi:M16 family metallopeptidase [Clostridium septicum]|uniref:Insulinase family protein n=1 Tax=Clostridium septicum TaxID=1504 RepID=A0A9N7JI65_CLOSE|nr:pitrilysin family protein [Clostridium septicum]AYE33014.1 peptidase M16 [Clostridium septicum]MDU1313407.1 pitrilysin family protein [Clostridium septicum]QAS61183.1 insulinase family protein [Clostridium septicum]UEC19469.1 insulinase family protein [Clostridium septicum]USR99578.1 insulinase family protein [Clostridium septicum]
MVEYILKNNIKLVYKKTTSSLTSISISLGAGAAMDGKKLGIAHATEHMVYKGTKNRSEAEINRELSDIFGFQNAMTNYPYVIYYGTLLNDDFKAGISLFKDILVNPEFKEDGFNEEMQVIIEELKEWDEELDQYIEDKLFLNSFSNRRLKNPIIGKLSTLKEMTLKDIRNFYNKYYVPSNTSIAVISSLNFDYVKKVIEEEFNSWEDKKLLKEKELYESPKCEIFYNYREGIKTCKVEIIYSIHNLTEKELKALTIFDEYFGKGVNSILYDTLRTKNGLIYDVLTKISLESHIKLYKINFSTSKENLDYSLKLINDCIDNIVNLKDMLTEEDKKRLIKGIKLKRLFREEQNIILAKELSTYGTMFNDFNRYLDEINNLEDMEIDFIIDVAIKVLKKPSIEIILGK